VCVCVCVGIFIPTGCRTVCLFVRLFYDDVSIVEFTRCRMRLGRMVMKDE